MQQTESDVRVARALVNHALAAIAHAYAPYSQFPVGAAVVDEQGRIFTGANVENASFGLTMCAERVAIFAAIASGASRIEAVAVASEKVSAISPCGACRQVMAEFGKPESPVYLATVNSKYEATTIGALLPLTFTPNKLTKL